MPRAQYSFALPAGFAAVGDSTPPARTQAPGSAPPAAGHAPGAEPAGPRAAPDWATELPIGLRQDRERTASREALMRSGAPVRRGRVEEGGLSRLSPRPPQGAALARESADPPGEGLLLPAANAAPPSPTATLAATQPAARQQPSVAATDMEALCEELIARLRRELLVERERMGTPLGA